MTISAALADGGVIVGLVGAVLGGSGAAFWAYMTNRREAPVKDADAIVATSKAVLNMQQDVLRHLRGELSKQAKDYEAKISFQLQEQARRFEREMSGLRLNVDDLNRENTSLRNDMDVLTRRNEHLEEVNSQLRERNKELIITVGVLQENLEKK